MLCNGVMVMTTTDTDCVLNIRRVIVIQGGDIRAHFHTETVIVEEAVEEEVVAERRDRSIVYQFQGFQSRVRGKI